MAKLLMIISMALGMSISAYGQGVVQSLGPLSEIYEKSGIKVGVPVGFNVVDESDFLWISCDGKTPLDAFLCRYRSNKGDCEVMVRGLYPIFLREGKHDNIASPLRFAAMEIANLDRIQGKDSDFEVPFFEDRLSCISGEIVRRISNADRIYYYDVDLTKTKFIRPKDKSIVSIEGLPCAKRVYVCKEGGYYFTFMILLPTNDDKLFLDYLMDVSKQIWFDGDEVRKKWFLLPR